MSRRYELPDWPKVRLWEWLAVVILFVASLFAASTTMGPLFECGRRYCGAPFVVGTSVGALASFALVIGRRLLRERRKKARYFRRALKPWQELKASLLDKRPKPQFVRCANGEIVLAGMRSGSFVQIRIGAEDSDLGKRKVHILVSGDSKDRLAFVRSRKMATQDTLKIPQLPPLGDDAFDNVARLAGSPKLTLAILDQSTRTEVIRAIGTWEAIICFDTDPPSFFLRDFHRCSLEQPLPVPSPDLVQAIEGCCGLASSLRISPERVLPRLCDNARKDPSPWVRCRNLQVLIEHCRDAVELPDVIDAALRDEAPAVRAIASTFAGGKTAFQDLSNLLARAKGPDQLRADALDYLVQHFPFPEVRALVEPAVTSSCEPLRNTALKAAATSGDVALVKLVCNLIKKGRIDHCERVVQWLASSRADCIEPALLDLATAEHPESALPAIEAIGEIGTERSIGPLLESLSSGPLRVAARAAVAKIQARLKIVDAGRLSIAAQDSDAGAVSLAAQPGEIEVVPPQGKRRPGAR